MHITRIFNAESPQKHTEVMGDGAAQQTAPGRKKQPGAEDIDTAARRTTAPGEINPTDY